MVKIIILLVNARRNLLIVLGWFTLLLVRVHLIKRRNVRVGGNTDFVSGPVVGQNEIVAIHDLATVGWPTCRQHYGRLFPLLVQREKHILNLLPQEVGLRRQPKEVRPVLHRTVQSEVKGQDMLSA